MNRVDAAEQQYRGGRAHPEDRGPEGRDQSEEGAHRRDQGSGTKASRAPTPPATPRELAPVAPPGSRSPRPPVPDARRVGPPGHTQPWSPDRAKALKT